MFSEKTLSCAVLIALFIGITSVVMAQPSESKHAVLLYPSRILNEYFPTFSLGYQYHSGDRWEIGATVGAVSDGDKSFEDKFQNIWGYDIGIEGRWLLNTSNRLLVKRGTPVWNSSKPLIFYVGFEASRAYTYRKYGLSPPDGNGVGRLVNARLVARRHEFTLGVNRSWRSEFGLLLDLRVGIGLNTHSWGLTDNTLTPAPEAMRFDGDDEGTLGLSQTANENTFYVAPRIRLGIGWQI